MLWFYPLFTVVAAHSWVERLMVLDKTGKMIGQPGYIRGAVARLDPSFTDFHMQHVLPTVSENQIAATDLICKDTQTMSNYSEALPPLRAKSGAFVALQHQENGHVTLPELSPQKQNSGMIYIYGTSEPSRDDTLKAIHRVWDSQGRGGDRRGRLLAVRPFDDGRCYQINTGQISKERQVAYPKEAANPQGADLWCQTDFKIPIDVISKLYTIYWVWDWPTSPSNVTPNGKDEIYTSCMDIEMIPEMEQNGIEFEKGQDLNWAGIEDQLSNK